MQSGILILTLANILLVKSAMIVARYVTEAPPIDQDLLIEDSLAIGDTGADRHRFTQRNIDNEHDNQYEPDLEQKAEEKIKKPCAIVVLSNIQNPSVQSLLRKYRYDANGILIPGSVKYFIKMPQGLKSSPLLVPLNDKAFSPLGGFVRYYKEVPPIPQAW